MKEVGGHLSHKVRGSGDTEILGRSGCVCVGVREWWWWWKVARTQLEHRLELKQQETCLVSQSKHYTWSRLNGGGTCSPTLLGPRQPQPESPKLDFLKPSKIYRKSYVLLFPTCSVNSRAPESKAHPDFHSRPGCTDRLHLCMSGHADRTEHMDWPYMLTVVLSSLKAVSEIKAGLVCL